MSLLRLFETVSDDCVTLALIQIKLTDVTDPMVNEKVADRVGEDLERVTHKVYFDIQINGSLNELPTKFTLFLFFIGFVSSVFFPIWF
ncbi:hypothetical protein Bca101_099454 [Brassica carinata]